MLMHQFCPLSSGTFHSHGTSVLGKFGRPSGTQVIGYGERIVFYSWNLYVHQEMYPNPVTKKTG